MYEFWLFSMSILLSSHLQIICFSSKQSLLTVCHHFPLNLCEILKDIFQFMFQKQRLIINSKFQIIFLPDNRQLNYFLLHLRLVFTSDGVVVGVAIRRVERYDLVKIKPTESKAEH